MKTCTALGMGVALLAMGCAIPRLPLRLAECPGALRDVADLPGGDYALREKLRVTGPAVDLALELVVERRGPRLVVVAFDPLGARAFSAVQEGVEVDVDSKLGRLLPISPRNVLLDLHAARLAAPESDAPVAVTRSGCEHSSSFHRVSRSALSPAGD